MRKSSKLNTLVYQINTGSEKLSILFIALYCFKCYVFGSSKGISLRKAGSTWVISCSSYPKCDFSYWLKGARTADVVAQGQCTGCGGRLLDVKFNRGSVCLDCFLLLFVIEKKLYI